MNKAAVRRTGCHDTAAYIFPPPQLADQNDKTMYCNHHANQNIFKSVCWQKKNELGVN